MRRVLLPFLVLAGCAAATDPDDGSLSDGKDDGPGCLESAESDEARGLLAFANDPAVTTNELRALGIDVNTAQRIVKSRPFADIDELDEVPNVGPVTCGRLRDQACDVRGLCEPVFSLWTWNIKHFPLTSATIGHVVVALDDAELVGFQEVDSLPAFEQLLAKLPDWDGIVGAPGFGTQVALAYRRDRLRLVASEALFVGDADRFPRPVLAATFEIVGRAGSTRFTVIDVHLKAAIDLDSERRRREAIVILDAWMVERRAAGENVIALGDWNDDIDDPPPTNVFMPILDQPEVYAAITVEVAQRDGYSYIPFRRLIDHIVLTQEAAAAMQLRDVDPVRLDATIVDYKDTVSDHRPVRANLIPILPTAEHATPVAP